MSSDFGDALIVVTDLRPVEEFLSFAGLQGNILERQRAAQYQLGSGKKLTVVVVQNLVQLGSKHAVEIRLEDFDGALERLNAFYKEESGRSRQSLQEAMALDNITLSLDDNLTTVVTIVLDLGTSRLRLARM
jgi:hypothetical protein